MESPGIERNLRLRTEWYASWHTAELPNLDEGSIRAYFGHQLDSGHLRPRVPKRAFTGWSPTA